MLALGQILLLWRNHRGLSQADLARRSGVARPNLSKIECGKKDASLSTLRKLAVALKVTPGSIVDGVPPQCLASPGIWSRETLEKIARAVHTGRKLANPSHQALADNLRIIIGPRLRALNLGLNPGSQYLTCSRIGRKAERAWLEFSLLPPSVRDSLIERAIEHAPLP